MWVDIEDQGRVVLPLELREQIGIVGETKLVVEACSDGRLTLGRVTLEAEFGSAEERDDTFAYDLKRHLRQQEERLGDEVLAEMRRANDEY